MFQNYEKSGQEEFRPADLLSRSDAGQARRGLCSGTGPVSVRAHGPGPPRGFLSQSPEQWSSPASLPLYTFCAGGCRRELPFLISETCYLPPYSAGSLCYPSDWENGIFSKSNDQLSPAFTTSILPGSGSPEMWQLQDPTRNVAEDPGSVMLDRVTPS